VAGTEASVKCRSTRSALNLRGDRAEFQSVKILSKYVLREHLGPLVFSLTALTSLLLLNYIAKSIGNLVGKGLPWSVIGEFVGLSVPFTFAMTLPMAVLVAVLYAFSRLAAENEITAMKASGVGLARLLIPVTIGATFLSVFMIGFNDQILPRSNHRLRTLMEDIARKKPTFALHSQVINEVSPGKLYLRAGHLDDASDRMREVVIYDLGDPSRRRTIYADSGTMALTAGGDLELNLFHGSMQDLQQATPTELQRVYYAVNHIRVKGVGNTLTRSTNDTYKSEREMGICEMQHDVEISERTDLTVRQELRYALVNGVRMAATGSMMPAPLAPGMPGNPFVPRRSLGRMYCDLIQNLFHTNVAQAQGVPAHKPIPQSAGQAPQAGQALPPSAGRGPIGARGLPPSAGRAPIGAQGLPPSAGGAAIENDPSIIRPAPVPAPPPMAAHGVAVPGEAAPTPVLPTAAAASLSSISAVIDADRARIEDNRRTNSTFNVEIQKKFAISIACSIFVLLGAPIALRFPRGGVGLVIGVSFAVFGLYYVGLIAGEPLAENGVISPFWAMWASNVVFTIAGIILLARVGRIGSTARGGDISELKDTLRGWVARLGFPSRKADVEPQQAV
jgi:lipopolysaccharide export system permease protein